MAGTGLPLPKERDVLPQPTNVVGAGVYSVAQSWLNIAQSGREAAQAAASEAQAGEKIASVATTFGHQALDVARAEIRQAQIAKIAEFEVDWRAKKNTARDQYSGDPEGFRTWKENNMAGALDEVPGWMLPHAKQFLSREFESAHASILAEKRAEDKRLDAQSITARLRMADEDVMSIASATGSLTSPEAKAAVATYSGILDSAVSAGLMAKDHGQLLSEDLTTRSQGAVIRKSVEAVYRESGHEAAKTHLDEILQQFGAQYKVTDKIRTATLGWLRSEEAGLRGERDAMSREWAAAKPNIATLAPAVLQDIQDRAYAVGNFRVGDDIQAHTSALQINKMIRQLPVADQIRVLATGNLESRLTQRESSGDPAKVNQFGYAGLYQFGAPRLADLGVYTPGTGENLAGWSKTPATAPGKWTGTFNIPGFPDVKTLEQFKASPEAQKAAFDLHQQRTEQEIDRLGLGSFVGQTIGGVPITRDGLRAMVHLGGAEGARATLTSGGRVNPADANGTTLLDYARLGGGGDITGSRAGLLALGLLKKDMTQDLTRKISDLQSAISKTEFPPMEEIGALGAQVHLLGNEEQKRQVAEMAAQAEYGRKFATLPAAQRTELVNRWNEKLKNGATAYERHLADTVKNADAKVTEAYRKDPYQAASLYMEGVPALPAVDWGSPTLPQQLAARVSVQNTIRADQGMGAFSALGAGEAAALGTQLVNGDPQASRSIIQALATHLPEDIYRATLTDAPVKTALDGMIRSYDPLKMDVAFSTLDRAYRADPLGFKAAFGDGTLGRLQTWQARKDELSPMQMAEYFKRADDPTFATARKALEKEADDRLKDMTPAKVANELGSVADRWVPFVNQAPPVDPLSGGALVAEYERLFKERYVETQNVDKAKAQAVERLKTVWGPSTVAGGALMRHPPERFYPQVDGSHDWMKRDVEAAIVASRFGEADDPSRPAVLFGKPFTYRLLSDQRTDADVAARRAPSYVVQVTDSTGRMTIPLDFEGIPMRFQFDPANAQERAREAFGTARERRLAAPDNLAMPVP